MSKYSKYIRTFQEIIEEFEFVHNNLQKKLNYYNLLIEKGYKIPSAGSFMQFANRAEIQEIKNKLFLEINRKYTLELIAAFEAKCVYFFKYKVKRKSLLGETLRKEVKPKKITGHGYLMLSDLINVFKESIKYNKPIEYSNFKNLIEYRNWLAHGRGWNLPSHLESSSKNPISDKFDFAYSYEVIINIMENLQNYPKYLMK